MPYIALHGKTNRSRTIADARVQASGGTKNLSSLLPPKLLAFSFVVQSYSGPHQRMLGLIDRLLELAVRATTDARGVAEGAGVER